MKVEKISDTQIKFVLNSNDLLDRDIRPTELAYGSEKTQILFREMMEKAMAECHFNSDNTPLMIEAVPLSTESIMIIVTKVSEGREDDKHTGLLEHIREAKRVAHGRQRQSAQMRLDNSSDSLLSIFSFGTMDEVAAAGKRLHNRYSGSNTLYKSDGR
ncbi:MAG: adaptor protein MecA, partial [Clostridiales bacterium]|nr:adaptor protein MecA [Clostridiales bacterium]